MDIWPIIAAALYIIPIMYTVSDADEFNCIVDFVQEQIPEAPRGVIIFTVCTIIAIWPVSLLIAILFPGE